MTHLNLKIKKNMKKLNDVLSVVICAAVIYFLWTGIDMLEMRTKGVAEAVTQALEKAEALAKKNNEIERQLEQERQEYQTKLAFLSQKIIEQATAKQAVENELTALREENSQNIEENAALLDRAAAAEADKLPLKDRIMAYFKK